MKKAVFLVLILAVAALGAKGYGGFVVSYMMPDFDALNEELSDVQGMARIEDDYIITYGGGGWGGGDHLMFGGWGFGGGRRFYGNTVSIKMTYGGGFFEPGYFINIWKGFGIMPMVGIGGTAVTLKLRPRLGDIDFGELLDNPGRTSEVSFRTFTLAPSLTILIPIEFIAIQIKGGYMWSPFHGGWELEDGADLRKAPEINPSGIFASAGLLFGFVGGD
ncbi:MAG: hypothetical protein E3J71_05045 [Candidatus Stahlbacteria bacterium]|nr:MAG: hypothetical protein E3J71_05045 [Candidatus Stahlbacteria bacterium]